MLRTVQNLWIGEWTASTSDQILAKGDRLYIELYYLHRYCCWSFQVQITKTKTKESVSIKTILKPAKYFHYHDLCCLNTGNFLVRSADNLEHEFSFQLGNKKMLSVCRYHDIFWISQNAVNISKNIRIFMSRLRPTADVVRPFLVEEFYMTSFFALVSYVISQGVRVSTNLMRHAQKLREAWPERSVGS